MQTSEKKDASTGAKPMDNRPDNKFGGKREAVVEAPANAADKNLKRDAPKPFVKQPEKRV